MERKVNVSWYSLLENSSEHLVSFDEFVRGRDQVFWSEHFQDYWIVVGLRPSLNWEMKNCRSCGQGRRVWLLLFMRRVLIVPPSRYCDHNIALLFKNPLSLRLDHSCFASSRTLSSRFRFSLMEGKQMSHYNFVFRAVKSFTTKRSSLNICT